MLYCIHWKALTSEYKLKISSTTKRRAESAVRGTGVPSAPGVSSPGPVGSSRTWVSSSGASWVCRLPRAPEVAAGLSRGTPFRAKPALGPFCGSGLISLEGATPGTGRYPFAGGCPGATSIPSSSSGLAMSLGSRVLPRVPALLPLRAPPLPSMRGPPCTPTPPQPRGPPLLRLFLPPSEAGCERRTATRTSGFRKRSNPPHTRHQAPPRALRPADQSAGAFAQQGTNRRASWAGASSPGTAGAGGAEECISLPGILPPASIEREAARGLGNSGNEGAGQTAGETKGLAMSHSPARGAPLGPGPALRSMNLASRPSTRVRQGQTDTAFKADGTTFQKFVLDSAQEKHHKAFQPNKEISSEIYPWKVGIPAQPPCRWQMRLAACERCGATADPVAQHSSLDQYL